MHSANLRLAEQLVTPGYIKLAENSINARENILKELLSQRQLPEEGLDQLTIEHMLNQLALMDSNNFYGKCGVGEREARIYSQLVRKRNGYLGHGIGRSGDIMANQPKAAGSSLILQLTKYLTVSAMHHMNYEFVEDVLLLPLATGMALTMALLTLKEQKPNVHHALAQAKYVVWPRIDQKTCLKCIRTANLEPLVVEEKLVGDALTTDVEAIDKVLRERSEEILCVLTTSSCFAPRVPDSLEAVSQLCKKYDVAHVLNNAYGLQCSKIANAIKESMRQGRLDCVVQSTDKNFMVPVGGSLIFSQRPQLIKQISEKYPGRACSSPIVDLFITLLEMGKTGIKRLYKERKENFKYMKEKAQTVMQRLGERVLETRDNSISLGLTLGNILKDQDPVELGSMLYSKKVMGHRILTSKDEAQKLCGNTFMNYGSHHQHYPFLPYMTIACAIGTQRSQIEEFFSRLESSFREIAKKAAKVSRLQETKAEFSDLSVEDRRLFEKPQQQPISSSDMLPEKEVIGVQHQLLNASQDTLGMDAELPPKIPSQLPS